MLPRVTMPRITLGKERQHRDKQHKASGVPVEKSIPSQPAWRSQFSCFRVIKQHCWWYTWILCVCRGQIQLSEALETHTQGSRCCRSLWAPGPFHLCSLPLQRAACNPRELLESTNYFIFPLSSVLLKGVTARDELTPVWLISPLLVRVQQFMAQGSTAEHLSNTQAVCRACRVIKHIPACWGHPGLQGSLQHCTGAQRAEETLKALTEVGTFGVGRFK